MHSFITYYYLDFRGTGEFLDRCRWAQCENLLKKAPKAGFKIDKYRSQHYN
jgi:hypothetical protein